MKRLPGRHWLSTSCRGTTWQHRLVSEAALTKMFGSACYAFADEASKCVYYSSTQTVESLALLFFHESHHIPSMVPGERHALQAIYGTTDDDVFTDREESGATYYGSVMYEAVGPFLRLPRPPYK